MSSQSVIHRKASRDKFEIMTDLVELCTIERRKTHLMTKANLNHSLIVHYLQLLIKQGLIEPRTADGYVIYRTTEKGRIFLEKSYNVISYINDTSKKISHYHCYL